MLNLMISDYAMKQQSNAAAECYQYQTISQATSGKCEVSNDDEEMMMVLLLLNEIDSQHSLDKCK